MYWFSVDKAGLAQILARRGKAFVVLELLQNAWDQDVSRVEIEIEKPRGSRLVNITVRDDDPNGFTNLAHAFTLFAPSEKKDQPEKRGRFNLGEKLVLALCQSAEIRTTTGAVRFDGQGRHLLRTKTEQGTVFEASLVMSHAEMQEALDLVQRVICPEGIITTVNGMELPHREAAESFEAVLPTEMADTEGYLRRTTRKTLVQVYEPLRGEKGTLFEMGIPVVKTGDRFHINVGQKIPLSMDRDNVQPSYLRAVRTEVLNKMVGVLTKDDWTAPWVREAMSDSRVSEVAAREVLKGRFGEKAVTYDASDQEANKRAVSKGFTIVHGGHLSRGEWEAARKAGVLPPAGQVTPSAKPFSNSPQAKPLVIVESHRWTPDERARVEYAIKLADLLIDADIRVRIADNPRWPFRATFGDRELILNRGVLGSRWFKGPPDEGVLALLLHEFAHHYEGDHLSDKLHDAICKLGARLALLSAADPSVLEPRGRKRTRMAGYIEKVTQAPAAAAVSVKREPSSMVDAPPARTATTD